MRAYRRTGRSALLAVLLGAVVFGERLDAQLDPGNSPELFPSNVRTSELVPLRLPGGASGARAGVEHILLSAIVPGTGQLFSGRQRGWVMLGLDALLVGGWLIERSEGGDDRRAYRDLAWEVARGRTEPRIDGDFEYFERMGKWLSSGAFDAQPNAAGVQPEVRPETFNGDAWRLARDLFLGGEPGTPGSPEWDAAVAWYAERAYPEGLGWDWREAPEARDRYRGLIESSDTHLRRAGWAAAAAVGLRVTAVLDLWIAGRTSGRAGVQLRPGPAGRLEGSIQLHPFARRH